MTVREILKEKKAKIRKAKLEKGSPSWDDILDETWEQIVKNAKERVKGYKTIKKLLTDQRFDKD
jgi:hypothetical protein